MSITECYASFGGNYEDVKERLRSDALIERFAVKFLSDTSYENLCNAMKDRQYPEAFRAAHTIKGVAMNLGFSKLAGSASQLTELLRDCEGKEIDENQCKEFFDEVSADYQAVITAVGKLKLLKNETA